MRDSDQFTFVERARNERQAKQFIFLNQEHIGSIGFIFPNTKHPIGEYFLVLADGYSEYQEVLYDYAKNELAWLTYNLEPHEYITESDWIEA